MIMHREAASILVVSIKRKKRGTSKNKGKGEIIARKMNEREGNE